MASDFYKRTKDLFEEFQKRELQFLNAEIAAKSRFQVLKENNMPVKKYLETLDKREKEAEMDFLELMRFVEDLEQQTARVADKLRKLESLNLSMRSKNHVQPYSSNAYDRSFQDYSSSSNVIKTDYNLNDYFSDSNQAVSSRQKDVEHASTQTDLMFCVNCQFPLTMSTLRLQESSPNDPLRAVLPSFQNQSLPSQNVENDVLSEMNLPFSDYIHKSEGNLILNKESDKEKQSLIAQSLPKIPEETPFQTEILHDKYQTNTKDISLSVPLNAPSSENKIATTVSSTMDANLPDYKEIVDQRMNEGFKTDLPTTTDYKENVPDVVLNETINILNSNIKERDKNLNPSPKSEAHSEKNKDSDLSKNIVASDLSTLSPTQNKSEGEISASKNSVIKSDVLKQDMLSDKGSESPISIAGAPSPSPYSDTPSALSDSDSFDGKEHLKESAAYQALLGNVFVTKKAQKTVTYSESDSEDEVEKALANATRRSSKVPTTTTLLEEKPDDSHKNNSTEPKAKNEPRKSISSSKSQQLSKSTRKVLGLDTSSASEGEIRIPAKTIPKTVEDSDDEFFYD